MALVFWFGHPQHWTPPKTSFEEAQWVLSATDEALPPVSQMIEKRHITPLAAAKAVDRYLMRQALWSQLNPEWEYFYYHPRVVVKAPGSAMSSGVRVVDLEAPEIEIVRQLRRLSNQPEQLRGVVEQFVEGDAIELSGVRLAGRIYFFHALRQHWSRDWTSVKSYERVFDHWWLYKETAEALKCIGLDDSAFCVEWRVTGYEQAKLIEINPRPGEDDKGYYEALWDRPIADQIEEWAQEVYRAESPETAQAQVVATHV